MNCQAINNILQNFIDGELSDTDAESVADHHRECPVCAMQYQETLAVIEGLRGVRVPPPSPGFSTHVIEHATKSSKIAPDRRLTYVASGIAASLIAFFVLASTFINPAFEEQGKSIVLVDDKVRTIKVAIDSLQTIDSVEMSIDISDNLEITGYESQKNIRWNTRLNQGINVIALPVSAIALGDGEITTRVRLNGREKIFTIKTRYRLPEKTGRGHKNIINAPFGYNPGVNS